MSPGPDAAVPPRAAHSLHARRSAPINAPVFPFFFFFFNQASASVHSLATSRCSGMTAGGRAGMNHGQSRWRLSDRPSSAVANCLCSRISWVVYALSENGQECQLQLHMVQDDVFKCPVSFCSRIFTLLSCTTNKMIKTSHLSGWNQQIFVNFAFKKFLKCLFDYQNSCQCFFFLSVD